MWITLGHLTYTFSLESLRRVDGSLMAFGRGSGATSVVHLTSMYVRTKI